MPKTVVISQGQCLASLAEEHHFYDWRTIYDDPANAPLRELRPNPNHLLPGDHVVIPDKDPRVETRDTGRAHRFTVRRQPTELRIRLEDLEPQRYRLEVGTQVFEGSGPHIQHRIPPAVADATLQVWFNAEREEPDLVWQLRLGHLDPADEVTGLKERLENLGFGPTDGPDIDEETLSAVHAFQISRGLEQTEEVDATVHETVRHAHDEDAS
ncbi:MAG: peptidoglycan-binding domain-containing protein [Polyangiaceae bacterium]